MPARKCHSLLHTAPPLDAFQGVVGVALLSPLLAEKLALSHTMYIYNYVNLLLVDCLCVDDSHNASTVVGLFTQESCEYFAAGDDRTVAVDTCTGLYPFSLAGYWVLAIPSRPLATYT